MPPINSVNHAAEVVCVAIGVNLLLPVAPNILKKYLEYIDTSASSIVKTRFAGVAEYLSDNDFKAIAVACKEVEERRKSCSRTPGTAWCFAEIFMVVVGVFLLWSNWIEQPTVAKWCPLLFLPSVFAVTDPIFCYLKIRRPLSKAIKAALRNAEEAKRKRDSENAGNDEYIVGFVDEARQAAGLG